MVVVGPAMATRVVTSQTVDYLRYSKLQIDLNADITNMGKKQGVFVPKE